MGQRSYLHARQAKKSPLPRSGRLNFAGPFKAREAIVDEIRRGSEG